MSSHDHTRTAGSQPPVSASAAPEQRCAADWVARLGDAHTAGRLQPELVRLGRYPLLVVDEVIS